MVAHVGLVDEGVQQQERRAGVTLLGGPSKRDGVAVLATTGTPRM